MMTILKKCSRCKILKELEKFCKDKRSKYGRASYCRPCFSAIKKINDPKYAKSEKGKIARKKAMHKYQTSEHGRKKKNESRKLREQLCTISKLKQVLRNRLRCIIKNKGLRKTKHLNEYIGCSPQYLKQHIESQFQPGMTWENHGFYGWHIDHIVPLCSAKTEDELYKLCHYTNLQPLWAKENLSKNKYIELEEAA